MKVCLLTPPPPETAVPNATRLVQVRQSPYIDTFHNHHHARIIIDSGATCNLFRLSAIRRFRAKVTTSSQSAHQADGSSPLKVVGEARLFFTRDTHTFQFEGLVVEDLDVDILAGTPFMSVNDIAVRSARRQVILGDGSTFTYGSAPSPTIIPFVVQLSCVPLLAPPPSGQVSSWKSICRQTFLLTQTTSLSRAWMLPVFVSVPPRRCGPSPVS